MIHVQIKIKKNFHVYIYMAMVFCFGSGVIHDYASIQTEKQWKGQGSMYIPAYSQIKNELS